MSSLSSRSYLVPLALACCLPLTSCNLFHKNDANTSGQYASTGNDGHYNPYPAGSQPSSYKYQQYNEAPPPPAYSGSDDGESHSKKKTTTHKKSSSGSKSDSGSGSGSKSKSKSKSKSGTSKSGSSKSGTTHSKSGSGSGSSSSRYTVKSSDTLYGIAKKHHTTVSKIKNMNDLSSDKIHEGQKLKLP